PCPGMCISCFLVQDARLGKSDACTGSLRLKLDRHDGFGPLRSPLPGDPRQFNEPIPLKPEKATIVRIAISLVTGFPEESRVDLGLHQQSSWGCKPAINLLRPCSIQHIRSTLHRPLARQTMWPR